MSDSGLIKVLSLGAGVQSSTVLRLAIHGEIERPDHVVFADTFVVRPSTILTSATITMCWFP